MLEREMTLEEGWCDLVRGKEWQTNTEWDGNYWCRWWLLHRHTMQ